MPWKFDQVTKIAHAQIGDHIRLQATDKQWILRIGQKQRYGPAGDIEGAKLAAINAAKAEIRSAVFDPLELIPRAYSLPSLTDYTGLRGTGGGEFTKLDVQHALSASRLGTGDIGPELLEDFALVQGGLKPRYEALCVAKIRERISQLVMPPIYSERCATMAANGAWRYLIYGKRDPVDVVALRLSVREGTYRVHIREAEAFASNAINCAMARFRRAISKLDR